MDNLRTFFQIPLVRLGVHVVIVVGFVLNIAQLYRAWEVRVAIAQQRTVLEIWNDLDTHEAYLRSDLYEEKYRKDKNYSNLGEEVVDTSSIEDVYRPGENEFQYAPSSSVQEKSNLEKWYECFFGVNRDECAR